MALLQSLGMTTGEITEKAMDAGQSNVAGRRDIVALGLDILKEVDHLLGSDVVKFENGRLLSTAGRDESKKQFESVTVTMKGVAAKSTHPRQVIAKEVVEAASECVG